MPKGQPPKGRKAVIKKSEKSTTFEIDCSTPIEDNVFYAVDLVNFLKSKIKVDGKLSNLEGSVKVDSTDSKKIKVTSEGVFSKRYLKYLTKKFLRKNELRDFLHVVANRPK